MNVEPNFRETADCACGCGLHGTVKKDGHVARQCRCPRCIAGQNRRKGLSKQRVARKALGVPDSKHASHLSNEESWRWYFRVEVKAGKQVGPVATRFLACETQALQNKAHGDGRPFMAVAMPEGMSDGIVMVRLSDWKTHIAPHFEGAA